MSDNTYCVYEHINLINGKIYIGQTRYGDDPNKRWRNGEGYANSTHFYNAICKYGWDGFDHKIVASNLTLDEANKLEEDLIQELHTTDPNIGYNILSGGLNKKQPQWIIDERLKSIDYWTQYRYQTRFDEHDPLVMKCKKCRRYFLIKPCQVGLKINKCSKCSDMTTDDQVVLSLNSILKNTKEKSSKKRSMKKE